MAKSVATALQDTEHSVFWLSGGRGPSPRPPLEGDLEADLVVVGGGLTGLWTALLAKEREPAREVVLLEGETIACGASGRNGGFCDASLTHGIANGMARWPDEMPVLERMGRENLDAIEAALDRHGIDAAWERNGILSVATEPHQVPWMNEEAQISCRFGWDSEVLDRGAAQAEIRSPPTTPPSGTATRLRWSIRRGWRGDWRSGSRGRGAGVRAQTGELTEEVRSMRNCRPRAFSLRLESLWGFRSGCVM